MENEKLKIVAMAEHCINLIKESKDLDSDLPQSLHPKHLLWMCSRIKEQSEEWSENKLHRWIGFVQCGMLANEIITFDGMKVMFDDMKKTYGLSDLDYDLIDHLNPDSSFRLDIGGEG